MYLTQYLHRAIQKHPDKIVSIFNLRTRTFREFGDRVAKFAGALLDLGMLPGDRVAMLSLNSDVFLEYQMAVLWAGGVLNPCNIRWAPAEIAYSLNDSSSSILILDDTFSRFAPALMAGCPCIKHIIFCGENEMPKGMLHYESLIANTLPVADAVRRGGDLAGVFYTGGTTGFPKGVMLSHANIGSAMLALRAEGIGETGGTYLHAAPMFHMADMAGCLVNWLEGNTHAIIGAFNPEAVVRAIERDKVTNTLLIPTMLQMIVDHPVMQESPDLGSLKTIFYGASAISEAILDKALDLFNGVDFIQAYGMTEMAPLIAINPPDFHKKENRHLGKIRAAGRVGYCVEAKIVDELGNEVPRGTVGEIVARGPNVMCGYWNRPQETAAAIRDGWMHTGDGAYMDDDGFIFVVDRMKDMIISGGENVYSAEVENALMKHPGIAQCAVIAVPSAEWGESVHAVVVLKPDATLSQEQVIAHCKALIAGYKCPRSISFAHSLPISGAGKVLKVKLRDPFWIGHQRKVS